LDLNIGPHQPPRIDDPNLFFAGFTLGLVLLVYSTWLADKAGTAMYERGFAKPFYIWGRRIHHSCIYLIVPASYVILGTLFFLGYVQIVWGLLWIKLAFAGVIAGLAMAADFLGDKYWPRIRKDAVLHHEWIYTLLPAYLFTYVVHITL
jgi:hypothetical protein